MQALRRLAQEKPLHFIKDSSGAIASVEKKVLDFTYDIISGNIFKDKTAPAVAAPVEQPTPREIPYEGPLSTVDISGWYKVTDEYTATFYSITDYPFTNLGPGWTVDGLSGIRGKIIMISPSRNAGKDYKWSFTFQTDMDQIVEGDIQYVTSTILYPPGNMSTLRSAPLYGYYMVSNHVPTFYFSIPPPSGVGEGWIIDGLPTLGSLRITEFEEGVSTGLDDKGRRLPTVTLARLRPSNGSIPDNSGPVYVKGFPSIIHEAEPSLTFSPGRFYSHSNKEENVILHPKITSIEVPVLRELDEGMDIFPEYPDKYIESKNRGFSQGSVLSLFATGPQDAYIQTDDFTKSQWNPEYKQHSNFAMFQRIIPFDPPNPYYQGSVIQLELRPTELGHLLSNMYFKCTLPALSGGCLYSPEGGRSLIQKVELLINETIIETLYDDWYIIRDQLFLDADETYASQIAVGSAPTSNLASGSDIVIPLDFFFCRRHSHYNKTKVRLERPFFPLCAMLNQKLYVRFTFNKNSWWTNAGPTTDMIKPKLITEEILLNDNEKIYYQNTPLKYIINKVLKESGITFNQGKPLVNLTANFPVTLMTWFFRNKNYESTSNLYFDSRYNYGYTTKYINTSTLTFPSGVTNYIDVIDNAKITLNNIDILSNFPGSLYFSFQQPMQHKLSIPSKNIYMYSFGLNPKEYNQGGYLNFAKLNSQTTTLSISFLPQYSSQIISGYNLYVFYYGYTLLQFDKGFASLPYL
jgi:hypothetical protein